MTEIVVEGLRKTFKAGGLTVTAMDDVSFRVEPGEMLVLLGPSGCGKTTTLRCLAGLEQPDEGTIAVGGRPMWDRAKRINVQVHHRDIGLVFQTFALWPHLTAEGNIEFPLRERRVPRAERKSLVNEVAALVDLDGALLNKNPGQLSGGQQQRVALCRALVAKPALVLFDEPLSNLDTLLREQLRTELRTLHRRLGFTGVYVTHDLGEALALGDRVAVMRHGRMEQVGRPAEVFEQPSSLATARLVGYRPLCQLTWSDGRWRSDDAEISGDLSFLTPRDDHVEALCRPDELAPCLPGQRFEGIRLSGGIVHESSYLGSRVELVVRFGTRDVRAFVPDGAHCPWRVGDPIVLGASAHALRFYDDEGRRRETTVHAARETRADEVSVPTS